MVVFVTRVGLMASNTLRKAQGRMPAAVGFLRPCGQLPSAVRRARFTRRAASKVHAGSVGADFGGAVLSRQAGCIRRVPLQHLPSQTQPLAVDYDLMLALRGQTAPLRGALELGPCGALDRPQPAVERAEADVDIKQGMRSRPGGARSRRPRFRRVQALGQSRSAREQCMR